MPNLIAFVFGEIKQPFCVRGTKQILSDSYCKLDTFTLILGLCSR